MSVFVSQHVSPQVYRPIAGQSRKAEPFPTLPFIFAVPAQSYFLNSFSLPGVQPDLNRGGSWRSPQNFFNSYHIPQNKESPSQGLKIRGI